MSVKSLLITVKRKLISWNNTVLIHLQGQVIGATCIGQDTPAKPERQRKNCAERTRKWLELMASIPSFLIGLSPDLRIIKWNSSAERIFGIVGDRMLGVSI